MFDSFIDRKNCIIFDWIFLKKKRDRDNFTMFQNMCFFFFFFDQYAIAVDIEFYR